jgi:hypothetical protein
MPPLAGEIAGSIQCQRQQSPDLIGVLIRARQTAQPRRIMIQPQWDCLPHGEPPWSASLQSDRPRAGEPPKASLPPFPKHQPLQREQAVRATLAAKAEGSGRRCEARRSGCFAFRNSCHASIRCSRNHRSRLADVGTRTVSLRGTITGRLSSSTMSRRRMNGSPIDHNALSPCDSYRVSSSHFGRRSSASWRAGSLVPTCARPLGVETAPVRTLTGRLGASKS